MITEAILNNFKNNIISEDIPMPHGSKRAKVVTHLDLDGLISGITMVHQLQKQGIPKERIKIELAQYGDEGKEKHKHTEKFIGRKGEFVGVTDFAKLPKVKPYSIFQKLTDFKGDKKKFVLFMKSRNFKNVPYEEFKKVFTSMFNVPKNQWTEKSLKELHEALGAYYSLDKKPELTADTVEKLNYQLVNPDFVSDHHSNEQGSLSAGKTGEIATDSPSEAEELSKRYVPGLWSKEDVEAVSTVDSAKYNLEQLTNTIFLDKNFKGPDKKKNLAIILSCIYDNMAKKDREAAKWVIKNSQPSLVSAYTNTLKAAKFSGKRLEYVNALKNGEVDKAKALLKEIPDLLNKSYDRHNNPTTPIMDYEGWRKKNAKDVADMATGYKDESIEKKLAEIKGKRGDEAKAIRDAAKEMKGKVQVRNNFTIFNGKDNKKQYSRYMTSLYSKDGMRSPFTMRFWNGFFQVAKNALYKGKVNFAAVNEKVLEDIKNFLLSKGLGETKVNIIIDNMKEKNGGHSDGIWSFQGFDQIKPTSKETGNYWMAKRIHDKNPNAPTASRIVKEKEEGVMKKYKDLRDETMKKAMVSAINWTNKLCPVDKTKIDGLKNTDERFEDKSNKEIFK